MMLANMDGGVCGGVPDSASRCRDRGRETERLRGVVSGETTAYVASAGHARPYLYLVRR